MEVAVSSEHSPTVIKLGGSVLTGLVAYEHAATYLETRIETDRQPLLVVVSAELGHTDTLQEEARTLSRQPSRAALDLLWSTGELRSVALLTLALDARGVPVAGLNVHESGLRAAAHHLHLNPIAIRAALDHHDIVVVPGFLATSEERLVTLGRGGSDLSAVMLAVWLEADRCELVKDVDGYFATDPNLDRQASLIPALDFDTALRMADAGCPLVQRQAVAAARDAGLTLVVKSLTSEGTTLRPVRSHDFPSLQPFDSQGDHCGLCDTYDPCAPTV